MKKCRTIIVIFLVFLSNTLSASEVDHVVVKKSEHKMYLLSQRHIVKEYHVVFGAHPKGQKLQEGDERTPEGKYILDYKKKNSSFYKAIHISFPNEQDKINARKRGVNPGGQIMIHGQKNGFGWISCIMQHFNWTDGCIAVTNKEMDEIWQLIKPGTPIEITP